MPALVLPLAEIAPLLPARGALIGLDLGTKTIGVAASDPTGGWPPEWRRSSGKISPPMRRA